jgi:hypothetical protein
MKTVNLSLTKSELDVLFIALSEVKINASHIVLTEENEAKRKIAEMRANDASELMYRVIGKFHKLEN